MAPASSSIQIRVLCLASRKRILIKGAACRLQTTNTRKVVAQRSVEISVVVPVYGCCDSLPDLVDRTSKALLELGIKFELILVNDGSPDEAWVVIQKLATKFSSVLGLSLSRNFGQHAAISAGLSSSCGEWVVIMDCDLQDRPEEIPNLYQKAMEGFDQVVAVRAKRQDSWIKRYTASLYVSALSFLVEQKVNPSVGNFGIYHRRVIDAIISVPEQRQTFGLMALWTGFRRFELEVDHASRVVGRSSYSFQKLLKLAMDGIVGHSDRLLRLTASAGFWTATASLRTECALLTLLCTAFGSCLEAANLSQVRLTLSSSYLRPLITSYLRPVR